MSIHLSIDLCILSFYLIFCSKKKRNVRRIGKQIGSNRFSTDRPPRLSAHLAKLQEAEAPGGETGETDGDSNGFSKSQPLEYDLVVKSTWLTVLQRYVGTRALKKPIHGVPVPSTFALVYLDILFFLKKTLVICGRC